MAQSKKQSTEIKRLYRSKKERQMAGVCGGVAEFFNVDPTIIRLGTIILIFLSGVIPGILAYIVAAIVIPEDPSKDPRS